MKKAAILTAFNPCTYKGGIETFIMNLKELLTGRNIDVDLHYISPEPTLSVNPFPVKSLAKKIPELLTHCFMLGRAFSKIEKDYDLVIANNFYGLGYFSPKVKSFNIYHSTHAGYADALEGTIPDSFYRDLKYFFGHLGDRMGGRGKGKIAVSQAVREELYKYYGFRTVSVVNHGIDTTFFRKIEETTPLRKQWNIPPDAFVGIFVGRWEIGKGTDILEEVSRLHPDITWLFVIGPSECLLRRDNIRVIQNADMKTLRELYSLSDFMLMPSCYEGFGMTIIEAMACKLPVICTRVGIAKDLFHYDAFKKLIVNAFPHRRELIKGINDCIAFLKTSEDGKNEIIHAGRSLIEREYTIAAWQDKMGAALGLPLS